MAVAIDTKALLEAGVHLDTKLAVGTLKWRHTFTQSVKKRTLLT